MLVVEALPVERELNLFSFQSVFVNATVHLLIPPESTTRLDSNYLFLYGASCFCSLLLYIFRTLLLRLLVLRLLHLVIESFKPSHDIFSMCSHPCSGVGIREARLTIDRIVEVCVESFGSKCLRSSEVVCLSLLGKERFDCWEEWEAKRLVNVYCVERNVLDIPVI